MNYVEIPVTEYEKLCEVKGRVNALADLYKQVGNVEKEIALVILGVVEECDARKQDDD